jgi:hypothetical protein
VIGVILLDTIDDDYVAIVLGRDEGGRFRAFDLEVSLQTMDEAVEWIIGTIMWHTSTGQKVFPQGDVRKGVDLFSLLFLLKNNTLVSLCLTVTLHLFQLKRL